MSGQIIISIITINFNNDIGLEKTISSVVSQNYSEIEYLIIDGGSKDKSIDIIKKYDNEITYWVSEKDKGIYNAQNKGLRIAKGEYVLFLNSGDYFKDDTVLEHLVKNSSGEDVIYGDIIFKSEEKEIIQHFPDSLSFEFFLKDTLPHPCTLIRRNLFVMHGMYDESFSICADWVFFMDVICKHNTTYKHVNKVITVFPLGGLSSKPGSFDLVQKEKQEHVKKSYAFFYKEYEHYKVYKQRMISLQQSRFVKLVSHAFPSRIKKIIYQKDI